MMDSQESILVSALMDQQGFHLYTSDEVPQWMLTRFILNGYRNHLTAYECAWSMFRLHNETVNSWSHLLAAFLFWYFAWGYFPSTRSSRSSSSSSSSSRPPNKDIELALIPKLSNKRNNVSPMVSLFCMGQASVFTVSAFAHAFSMLDEAFYRFCWRLDWTMIAVAMLGTSTSFIHYAFGYSPKFRRRKQFWMAVFGVHAISMILLFNHPLFTRQGPHLKICGALTIIPFIAGFLRDISVKLPQKDSKKLVADMAPPLALSLLGSAVYGLQFPERFAPGAFDLTGASHALHHLWTFVFSCMMLRNLLHWDQWRSSQMSYADPSKSKSRSTTCENVQALCL